MGTALLDLLRAASSGERNVLLRCRAAQEREQWYATIKIRGGITLGAGSGRTLEDALLRALAGR